MCDRQSHNRTFVNNINQFEVRMYDSIKFPKTNIMATIGPASFNQIKVSAQRPKTDTVEEMVSAGMNLTRINLAHVQDEDDRENVRLLINRVQEITRTTRSAVGISVDLAGPKFRLGVIEPTEIEERAEFVLTLDPDYGLTQGTVGTPSRCSIDVEPDFLIHNIRPGQEVLIDDGFFSLVVKKMTDTEIYCEAKNSWKVIAHKGVNFPGCVLTDSALTRKDIDDLIWLFDKDRGIAKHGQIDYISVSFVKSAGEIRDLKANLRLFHQQHIKVIAKIETLEAVDLENNFRRFDAILAAADAIMVARGDLGAEIGIVNVPEIQLELIRRAKSARKPSIVATQMLESMRTNRFPTRAEVTDVSNAIREGADIVMLSGETSAGIDPPGAVRMMAAIACRTERWVTPVGETSFPALNGDFTQAIGHPIVEWAAHINAKLIIVYTTTGYTAKVISHYRPNQPIIAITHSYDALMELNLYWGIYSILINYVPNSAEEAKHIASSVIEHMGLAMPGDVIIMTMSMTKLGIPDSKDTNTIHVFKHETSSDVPIGISQTSIDCVAKST
jgi:pyruvate kinase